MLNEIKHVIFDIDGVLVNSLEANRLSLLETMRMFDIECYDEYLLLPVPTIDKIRYLEQKFNRVFSDTEIALFKRKKFEFLKNYGYKIRLNSYASSVIQQLHSAGVKITFVTNARSQYAHYIHSKLNLCYIPIGSVGSDMRLPTKPNTAMFDYAVSISNVPAENTLIVEDTDVNIEAARNAGYTVLKIEKFEDILKVIE